MPYWVNKVIYSGKLFILNQMSSDLSDDDTLTYGQPQTMEKLQHENKMKEIALRKATNLI